QPPYLFHGSHAELRQGRMQTVFRFGPEWIMEVLGMAEFDPADRFQVNLTETTAELIKQIRSPQGIPQRKLTVFNRPTTHGNQPQVTAHILQDTDGKEICGTYITEVQHDRATGAIVPRRLQFVWPAERLRIRMRLDGVMVNPSINPQRAERLFNRP